MDFESNHAVAVILETPSGIPLIMDPQKPVPRYWKFPGGRSEAGETPLETAARELREETGITLHPKDLRLLFEETRQGASGKHKFFLFYARIEDQAVSGRGTEGEMVKMFPAPALKGMADFFPNHRALWEAFLGTEKY